MNNNVLLMYSHYELEPSHERYTAKLNEKDISRSMLFNNIGAIGFKKHIKYFTYILTGVALKMLYN